MDYVKVYTGGLVIDDRGVVAFANECSFEGIKRFYTIRNHRRELIRAWHAHKKEAKYITVLQGAALVGAVKVTNFEWPYGDEDYPQKYILSSLKPSVLYVPPGYANGFMSLTDETLLGFFSTATLEESQADDYRYDYDLWDIWRIEER